MIEKIIRSPLSMMFFILLFGGLIWSKYYSPIEVKPYTNWITIGILVIIAVFFILIMIHNQKHPNRKINFFGWIPYEFKEEDEGKQWVTFQACRKVYIFFSFAIPISIILIALIEFPALPLLILIVIGMTQYGIFWWEENKYYKSESEEDYT
ncbi:hypothetical protein GMD78_08380 [Ornithinibacillus sp. L9]|uniref:Uncharacterized protein n=1 Tax=Ornithinibacillus caprae TaxID=2678566 RepID=A0A6N8FG32_9BACI|nr:hypothetical protein [Ornithinibacillus caprae]MUK88405.1 hypothetical protein [Ornithinibacillus caprae]